MSKTLIYIDGELADVSPETIIAITFQSMPIGDIQRRIVSHTNQIQLPATPNNNRIFEHANKHQSNTRKPYNLVDVRVVQNGLETLRGVMGILQKSEKSSYSLGIYDNTKGLFDAIKDKFVDEIDIAVYEFLFSTAHKNDLTPISHPVIDYGRLLIPEIPITNNEFDGVIFNPWEMPDSNDPSFASGASLWVNGVTNKIEVTLTTTAPGTGSQFLFTAHPFRKGFQYQILIRVQVISGSNTGNILIEMQGNMDDDPLRRQTIVNQSINTVAIHIINQTVTANNDYENITLLASQITGGINKIVRLLEIEIRPVHAIDIKPIFYFPTINYLLILQKIVTNAGFNLDISAFTASDLAILDKLHITFSKGEVRYNTRLIDKYRFIAHAPGTQVVTVTTTPQTIVFNDVEFNGSAQWYEVATSRYKVAVIPFNLRIQLFIRLTVNVTAIGTQINFFLYNADTDVAIQDKFGNQIGKFITTTGIQTFTLKLPPTLIKDTAINYAVKVVTPDSGTVEIQDGEFYSEIGNEPIGFIHLSNLILPDMLQKDFFADFLYRFGCMINNSNKTIEAIPIQHVIEARTTAKDWTNKRDISTPETITYLHNSYGQKNYFSDNPSDDLHARGFFEIDSEQLPEEKFIYTSPFRVPDYTIIGGIRVVRVPVFDFETNNVLNISSNFEDGIRLVLLRDRATTDPEVKYNGVVSTSHKVAVYDDPGTLLKANWQHFIDNFYSNLQIYLNQTKIITRMYYLTDVDINSLDLTELIYDDGAYFKIEKVHNYIPGRVTKVELFKVS